MRVVITADALNDLIEIGDHIARDNPDRARIFIAELLAKINSLSDLPKGFPIVPRYAHLDIRRRSHGNYLIFYRVDEDEVVIIIHVLHAARDYEKLLFPE